LSCVQREAAIHLAHLDFWWFHFHTIFLGVVVLAFDGL
jgi:hypothetical protein